MENVIIKRLLIVRNDTSTAWEKSNYILQKGEIGVGYIQVGDVEKPIVKLGDGKHPWRDLAQTDYILEENQIINYDLGRHKTIDGIVDAGGAGMSISEWLLDAFKTERLPKVTLPSFDIKTSISVNPNYEIGSAIERIAWTGTYTDGQYEFGSVESTEKSAKTTPIYAITFQEESSSEPNGSHDLSETYITQVGTNNLGNIKVCCTWSDAERTPLNSQGKPVPEKRIITGSIQFERACFVEGYAPYTYCLSKDLPEILPISNRQKNQPNSITISGGNDDTYLYIFVPIGKNDIKTMSASGFAVPFTKTIASKSYIVNNGKEATYKVFKTDSPVKGDTFVIG